MPVRINDKTIRHFFWNVSDRPFDNKASYLLGDLSGYGVSNCIKVRNGWQGVYYQFFIYRQNDSIISLSVELSIDFTLNEVEKAIISVYEGNCSIGSNNKKIFYKWAKEIAPQYKFDHAKYSAMRFLEALRKRMIETSRL